PGATSGDQGSGEGPEEAFGERRQPVGQHVIETRLEHLETGRDHLRGVFLQRALPAGEQVEVALPRGEEAVSLRTAEGPILRIEGAVTHRAGEQRWGHRRRDHRRTSRARNPPAPSGTGRSGGSSRTAVTRSTPTRRRAQPPGGTDHAEGRRRSRSAEEGRTGAEQETYWPIHS